MDAKDYFSNIDFNKAWDENDWETYFQAQDAYRLAAQTNDVRKKPISRIRFEKGDEVRAFEPVIREYSVIDDAPSIFHQLRGVPFWGDENPDAEYHPATDEDPHYWGEGAPLSTVLIYRDCCRFAICAAHESERYLKMRKITYRQKHGREFEMLRFHANWIAINIAQGHRIGYSEDRIRGNIAKVQRALKHANTCLALLTRVSQGTRSVRLKKDLFSFAVQLRNGLFDWLDELRRRV